MSENVAPRNIPTTTTIYPGKDEMGTSSSKTGQYHTGSGAKSYSLMRGHESCQICREHQGCQGCQTCQGHRGCQVCVDHGTCQGCQTCQGHQCQGCQGCQVCQRQSGKDESTLQKLKNMTIGGGSSQHQGTGHEHGTTSRGYETGSHGMEGSYGTQGMQGSQGMQGMQGSYGTQGMQGSYGTQGMQGSQGVTTGMYGEEKQTYGTLKDTDEEHQVLEITGESNENLKINLIHGVEGSGVRIKSWTEDASTNIRHILCGPNALEVTSNQEKYIHALNQENCYTVTIPRRSEHHEKKFIPNGYALCWQFVLQSHDIEFSLKEIVQDDNNIIRHTLIGKQLCKSGVKIQGKWEVNGDTNVILVWNNSFSKLTSKTIDFKMALVNI